MEAIKESEAKNGVVVAWEGATVALYFTHAGVDLLVNGENVMPLTPGQTAILIESRMNPPPQEAFKLPSASEVVVVPTRDLTHDVGQEDPEMPSSGIRRALVRAKRGDAQRRFFADKKARGECIRCEKKTVKEKSLCTAHLKQARLNATKRSA